MIWVKDCVGSLGMRKSADLQKQPNIFLAVRSLARFCEELHLLNSVTVYSIFIFFMFYFYIYLSYLYLYLYLYVYFYLYIYIYMCVCIFNVYMYVYVWFNVRD